MSVSPQVATGRDGADDQVTRLMREVGGPQARDQAAHQRAAGGGRDHRQSAGRPAGCARSLGVLVLGFRGLDIRVREPAGARHCRDHLAATRDGARETWRRSQARERRADVVGFRRRTDYKNKLSCRSSGVRRTELASRCCLTSSLSMSPRNGEGLERVHAAAPQPLQGAARGSDGPWRASCPRRTAGAPRPSPPPSSASPQCSGSTPSSRPTMNTRRIPVPSRRARSTATPAQRAGPRNRRARVRECRSIEKARRIACRTRRRSAADVASARYDRCDRRSPRRRCAALSRSSRSARPSRPRPSPNVLPRAGCADRWPFASGTCERLLNGMPERASASTQRGGLRVGAVEHGEVGEGESPLPRQPARPLSIEKKLVPADQPARSSDDELGLGPLARRRVDGDALVHARARSPRSARRAPITCDEAATIVPLER